jgi:glycosyltransferase involved in cell wall biosynthesis
MAERRLKVIQMLPALDGGGVERGTLEIGAELVRRGHESIVISAGGRMVEELEAAGSEHICWDVGAKRLSTLLWIPKVRKLLRERKPDILHLRSRLPAWIGYLAWKGLPENDRPFLVTTVHGPYTVNWYSAVMTKGQKVIAVSETIKDYILENYPEVDPSVIQVIHRGVDRMVYPFGFKPDAQWLEKWKAEYPQLEGKYIVTLPGRLTRWKGQEDFIDIIQELKDAGVPVHGLLVGSAHPRKQEFRRELENKIEALGLTLDITFTGHRLDLREIMSVSDVVLSLSLEPEAFGRTTIEALSLGVPVVGYAHGGVKEQLQEVLPGGMVSSGSSMDVVSIINDWFVKAPSAESNHTFTLLGMLDRTLALYQSSVGMRLE